VAVPYVDVAALLPADTRIDLLKVDIEGSELDFVAEYAADLLPRVRHLVIELHHGQCDTGSCVEILRATGFAAPRVLREEHGCSLLLFSREPACYRDDG
jgi:hypothetical protein